MNKLHFTLGGLTQYPMLARLSNLQSKARTTLSLASDIMTRTGAVRPLPRILDFGTGDMLELDPTRSSGLTFTTLIALCLNLATWPTIRAEPLHPLAAHQVRQVFFHGEPTVNIHLSQHLEPLLV
jgi:hypothetical protein